MWIKQKGLILISFRLSAFRLWLPISTHVLFELIYGFYELFSFFILISGQSRKIRLDDKRKQYSTSLKDIDVMMATIIYFLENARNYESFDLVDIDVIDKESRHIVIKISFV